MRKSVYVLSGIMCALVFFACKKQSDPNIPPPFYPPNDTTLHTAGPLQILLDVSNGISVYNAWGKLIAMKSDSATVVSPGDTVHVGGQYGIAFFVDSNLVNTLDAGTLTLNNVNIPHPAQYFSYKGVTDSLALGANWVGSGTSSVPAISYFFSGGFPSYTGAFPYAVSKTNGMQFTFNSSTLNYADSIYVILTTVDSGNIITYSQVFSATAGAVNITGSAFNYVPASTITQAHLTLIPFKYTTAAFGDKKFVFVKEAELSHTVVIQ